jgi:predicted GH43/DUF377 family glycosyl hydrolase
MIVERSDKNPILKPNNNQSWEAEAVFNGCPVKKGEKIYLLYRALSLHHYHALANVKMRISDIGIAESKDGVNFGNRRKFIIPEYDWEQFGCEDPRVTKLNGKFYIFYTALSRYPFNADGIKVAVAVSRDLETIQEKHLVTPFNAKAMTLFPEKIGGKIYAGLTVHTDRPPSKICLAPFDREADIWSEKYWNNWYKNFSAEGGSASGGERYSLPLQRKPEDHVELGAPPLKTANGWLLLYSYIRNYFLGQGLFGVEAVLLDLKNPSKIIARTEYPILTPEEYYERFGMAPNTIFPSGAFIKDSWIYLYYGAADTTCALARIKLSSLFTEMTKREKRAAKLTRIRENPIIVPDKMHAWEAKATFNPAAIYLENKVHLLYRAMSEDNTSTFGYAQSGNGSRIDWRLPDPVYTPRESFEQKAQPNGNSGCEDPRLTQIGDKIYMCYTAFDGKAPPRVALTWIGTRDFLGQKWNWAKPALVSPPDFDNKDALVFPEKVNGKFMIIHRVGEDIDFSFAETLNFSGRKWLEEYRWIITRKGWWDSKKVGAAAPPLKTKDGWIFLYHGVSDDGIYRVGAVLLDLKNPTKIIGRTDNPIFEPEAAYEKVGVVPNVVFPCGAVVIGKKLFVYYGGADKVIGVATIKIDDLLHVLKLCRY